MLVTYWWVVYVVCLGYVNALLFHSDHDGLYSTNKLAPCQFNGLCRCSGSRVDWGIVSCHGVPMGDIPAQINNTRVLSLAMSNNRLHVFSPHRFHRTGLWRLEIRHNSLSRLDANALSGLEHSLWELDLQYNNFIAVPKQTLFRLQRLTLLDLSGNMISEINEEDLSALRDSLESLYLRDNAISSLENAPFSEFTQLKTLDLSDNQLLSLGEDSLKTRGSTIQSIYLADNLFSEVPSTAIGNADQLDLVDLTGNVITSPSNKNGSANMKVTTFHLDHNKITQLDSDSLASYGGVERLYLSGNPLQSIADDTFRGTKFRELYINGTYLQDFGSFAGLEGTLETLNLKDNNFEKFPENQLEDFTRLQNLYLSNNKLNQKGNSGINNTAFSKMESLRELSLSGKEMTDYSLPTFQRLTRLRHLSVKMKEGSLESKPVNGKVLEKLSLEQSGMTAIKADAFDGFSGLRYLDISHNEIKSVEDTAFQKNGHALEVLEAFAGLKIQTFPKAFTHFTNIRHLHLPANPISKIPEDSFDNMKKLEVLDMENNKISSILPGTLKGRVLKSLKKIDFDFNQLQQVPEKAFFDLSALVQVKMGYNKINLVEQSAFVRLNKLQHICLRMNSIAQIESKSFQSLPYINLIDLSHNKIRKVSFGWFELVGTLSPSMKLDLSFNDIAQLDNSSSWQRHVNIKELDLSHNKISGIHNKFLQNIRTSLLSLSLAHNQLRTLSYDNTGYLPNLLVLDLSGNSLEILDPGTFSGIEHLNVLNLSRNAIHSLPSGIFDNNNGLNTLDLSFNDLHSLQDNLFKGCPIEVLFLQGNKFKYVPGNAFLHLSRTIRYVDISHNELLRLQTNDIGSLYNVVYLDLSHNAIATFEDRAFFPLQKISYLDLSHNSYKGEFRPELIHGIEGTISELKIANLSIPTVPKLKLPYLIKLDLAHNNIEFEEEKPLTTTQNPNTNYFEMNPKANSPDMVTSTTEGTLTTNAPSSIDDVKPSSLLAPQTVKSSESSTVQTQASPQYNIISKYRRDGVEQVSDVNEVKPLPLFKKRNDEKTSEPDTAPGSLLISKLRRKAMQYRHVYSGVDASLPLTSNSNHPFVTMPQLKDLSIKSNNITKFTNDTFSQLDQLQHLDISGLPLREIHPGTLSPLKNLKFLGLSSRYSASDFSVLKMIQSNQGLSELKLTVETERLKGQLHDRDGVTLPPHIRKITVTGSNLLTIDHDAFRDVHSWRLNLSIQDTRMQNFPRAVISNMKHVSQLHLDIRNNPMKGVGDMRLVDKIGIPHYVHINSIRITNNVLKCDCESIGWMEWWIRRYAPYAYETMMDAENSYCDRSNTTSIAEAFRDSLECIGISGSPHPVYPSLLLLAFSIYLVRPF